MVNNCWGAIGTSAAVYTPTTPGADRAASASTDAMRAWAITERTKTTCTVLGGVMSPT